MTAVAPPGSPLDRRIERLRAFLATDPANLKLLADLADVLFDAGRPDDAREVAQQALKLVPGDAHWQYRLAVAERQLGALQDARTLLEALIADGVDADPVRLELARVAQAQADWPAVVGALGTIRAPAVAASEEASFLLMRGLHHEGDLERAIGVGEAVLGAAPERPPRIVSALATLYLDAERFDDLARLVDEASGQHAADAELLAAGGYLAMHQAQPDQARQRFEHSIARAPGMARAHLGLGLVLATEGRLNEARESILRATEQMPAHLGSWHALAWLCLLQQDLDAAERHFEHALTLDRNFGDTYGGLAIVAALRGRRDEADEWVRTGLRLDRASLNVGVARTLLRRSGRLDDPEFLREALQMLNEQALSRDPRRKSLFDRLRVHGAGRVGG